jgi:hypothetical protein
MNNILKQFIANFISGNTEEANDNFKQYFIQKTKEVTNSQPIETLDLTAVEEGRIYSPSEAHNLRFVVKKHYGVVTSMSDYNKAQRAGISSAMSDNLKSKIIGEFTVDFPKHTSIPIITTGSSLIAVMPDGKQRSVSSTWKPNFEDFGLTKATAEAEANKMHGKKDWDSLK